MRAHSEPQISIVQTDRADIAGNLAYVEEDIDRRPTGCAHSKQNIQQVPDHSGAPITPPPLTNDLPQDMDRHPVSPVKKESAEKEGSDHSTPSIVDEAPATKSKENAPTVYKAPVIAASPPPRTDSPTPPGKGPPVRAPHPTSNSPEKGGRSRREGRLDRREIGRAPTLSDGLVETHAMHTSRERKRTPPHRHVWGAKMGGLRPTMYNWFVFGRRPGSRRAPLSGPTHRPTVESVSDDAGSAAKIPTHDH